MDNNKFTNINCPIPNTRYSQIIMAHGGGGKLMNELIEKYFITKLNNEILSQKHDSSIVQIADTKIAITTDSFVVSPLFFKGGNIGSLAVYGTVNDLAMSGAHPLYLSLALIIEEGFNIDNLVKIIDSIQDACIKANVQIITGDTKVVEKGKGDGVFINTTGIGLIKHTLNISAKAIQPNDIIIINGDIGRHGICILSAREGFDFDSNIKTDSCDLSKVVLEILNNNIEVHCMRDCTRGGLASALVELAQSSNMCFEIDEANLKVQEDVQGACELLGFDPIYIANEGRFITFVPAKDADAVLKIMQKHEFDPIIIGNVIDQPQAQVVLKSKIGPTRIIDMISGEQLPRIC